MISRLRRRCLAAALAGGSMLLARASAADPEEIVDVAGTRIRLRLPADLPATLRPELLAWIRRSAEAVAAYYGRFPVPSFELSVGVFDGGGVRGGHTDNDPSLRIQVMAGSQTTRQLFVDDWVLVHEMIHLSIPDVPRNQLWLHEGIATYVEGVARGRARLEAPRDVWGEWFKGMPKGLPQAGDAGMDHTPTWGRTYWGGALFCLLADIQVRVRSGGARGLQDALRGVLAAGGSYAVAWPVERTLSVADRAIGQTTLCELHEMMGDCPRMVDLPAMWADLGVTAEGLKDAPRSAIRDAILA